MTERIAQIRGTSVRLFRKTKRELVSCWPWVNVGTEARAAVAKRLWESGAQLPKWFLKQAVGTSSDPKPPASLFDNIVRGMR